MASYNRVILLGNLTRDVELRQTPAGKTVGDMGLAMNERYKDASGNWVESPVFVDVVMWGRTAEVASEYLSKGSPVHVEGRLKLDQWEQEGQKRSKLKVVADSIQLIGGKPDGQQRQQQQRPQNHSKPAQNSSNDDDFDKDDIPFSWMLAPLLAIASTASMLV